MVFSIATLMICTTSYGGWNVVYSPNTLETESSRGWRRLYRATFVLSSILLTGTTVLLELALHYVARNDQNYTLGISLTAGIAGSLLIAFFASRTWWYRRSSRSDNHAVYFYTRHWKRTTKMILLSFSWGASYHTFAYYLRM
jgi:hypothetical protein